MIQNREYQCRAVGGVSERWRCGHSRVLLVSPTGSGKCLAAGTPVLMFDGTVKPVESISVGELLMGPDSKPRRVLSLARGRETMYRVTPKKGEGYTVNESHILSLKMTADGKDGRGGEVVNLSVRDYLTRSDTFKHRAKGWRAAVDFPAAPVPVDPYYLGLWLADGSSAAPNRINKPDAEVAAFVADYAESLGLVAKNAVGSADRCPAWDISNGARGGRPVNPLSEAMKSLGVVGNKHVPHVYLANSRAVRLAILAGLLDGDGHLSRSGFDFSNTNERIADAVVYLCRSLGLAAYKSARETQSQSGAWCHSFRVSISGNTHEIPCRIARKRAPRRTQKKDVTVYGITVESVGEGEYFGFEVDGDGLFLLGDFTVTHNTTMAADIIRRAVERGKRVLVIAHRRRLIQQIAERCAEFGIHYGVTMADLPDAPWARENPNAPLQIASRDTLLSRVMRNGWRDMPEADLLIIDEAHNVEAAQYLKLAESCRIKFWIGLTATPCRADGRGLGSHIWDSIVEAATVPELVAAGFLVPVKTFAPPGIGEKRKNGARTPIAGDAVDHWQRYAAGMPTVVFTRTVAESIGVRDRYRAANIPAEHIDAHTPHDERERYIADVEAGKTLVLTNASVLTEGVDIPILACCQLLCRCGSLVRLQQAVGRTMRPYPGKEFAVLLDHSGAVFEHGMPGEPVEWSLSDSDNLDRRLKKDREDGKRSEPRCCTRCGFMFAGVPACPECGSPIPFRVKKEDPKLANERLVQVAGAPGPERDRLQREWTRTVYMARAMRRTAGFAVMVFKKKFGEYPGKLGLTPSFPFEAKDTPVGELLERQKAGAL